MRPGCFFQRYFSHCIAPFSGGILAARYGVKCLFGFGTLCSSLTSFFSDPGASSSLSLPPLWGAAPPTLALSDCLIAIRLRLWGNSLNNLLRTTQISSQFLSLSKLWNSSKILTWPFAGNTNGPLELVNNSYTGVEESH